MGFTSQSIDLSADLFALAAHPSLPLLAAGVSSGHVYSYAWTPTPESDCDEKASPVRQQTDSPDAQPVFTTAWKTRRHKSSCRCLAYSLDGEAIYTAGTDHILKSASSETGRVITKAIVDDSATVLLPISPEHLLLGTDNGTILLYDLRTSGELASGKSVASWKRAHDDYISSLLALPAAAASATGFQRQFVATGDMVLTHLDVRRPGMVITRSEDQEDEIFCSAFVTDTSNRRTSSPEQVLTGTSAGMVTVWNKGFWRDHQNRVPLSRSTGDAVESLLALPEGFEVPFQQDWGSYFAAGSGDGKVRIVKMGQNKTVAMLAHSLSPSETRLAAGGRTGCGGFGELIEEGVTALALDHQGRIISGGGTVIKIWELAESSGKVDAGKKVIGGVENDRHSDRDQSSDSQSDEDIKRKQKRKKRKGGKGKGRARGVGVKNVTQFEDID